MHLSVHVRAGAKEELFEKISDTACKIFVREPAEENRANERVLAIIREKFLSNGRGRIAIVAGHRTPHKIISIEK